MRRNVNRKKSIGIITFPGAETGITPVSQLLRIAEKSNEKIYLITGNEIMDHFLKEKKRHVIIHGLRHLRGKYVITRIMNYLLTQVRLGIKIKKYSRFVDIWFTLSASHLIIPTIFAKQSKAKIIPIATDSPPKMATFQKSGFSGVLRALTKITYLLSDYIIVYSPLMIKEYGLEFFKKKILVAPQHFIDPKELFLKQPIEKRNNTIGFIGRFTGEKGILNFIESIKYLENENLNFIVIGHGDQEHRVLDFIQNIKLSNKIEYIKWIERSSLSDYMNKIKLLVIPSYTEGLPNVMLEAMASGTIVLASKVGSIPDVITDGINGFLLRNNDPKTIAEKIVEIIKKENLREISTNAISYIKKYFSLNPIQRRYNVIIHTLRN
ncbi:hypothetical protein LCGC14_1015670 [marine sediment metagenome]|uniref:Glycosyl transferase family 1 domain-containing protein n=1 Tax=marine sediment metagenome TaxID=412755 RepID=A0A0F9QH41_9ZZZZ